MLAAAQLQELGFEDATDRIGGVEDWKKARGTVLHTADEPVSVVESDEAVAR